ncbi:MAG: redoxin domain-containing protein [Chitinophagaceae bacterium]|nr:redoxin domain-containing protein [Chitinophagaceae bacterium]
MRSKFYLSLLFYILSANAYTQNDESPTLNIGDPAPPLSVYGWIKGEPFQQFEKGRIYVLEYWATWCRPCIAAMPRLTELAHEYKDKITVLGINTYEIGAISMPRIKAFVDSLGNRMDYYVAVQDSLMAAAWFGASGEKGIPRSFVIDRDGKFAWAGHPMYLHQVLPKIVNGTWDLKEALAKRNLDRHLRYQDEDAHFELFQYRDDPSKPGDIGKPYLALIMINKIVSGEPRLKYTPAIAYDTFSSLLKTNPKKAYEYGKAAIVTPTYEDPASDAIIGAIKTYSNKLNLPSEIYRLGAEACQRSIDQIPYPEIINMSIYYSTMAEWYWRAKDKSKAINSLKKAIEEMKDRKDSSQAELAALESRLQQYSKL